MLGDINSEDKEYKEYKKKARAQLIQKVSSDFKNALIQECVRETDEETDKVYYLDLVVSFQGNDGKYIYDICSPTAFLRNLKFLEQQLRFYKAISNATRAYLVYYDGDLQIKSLTELSKQITENNRKNSLEPEAIEKFSEFYEFIHLNCFEKEGGLRFFFRGHSNKSYKPIPSIFRVDNWIKNEKHLYHEATRQYPSLFSEEASTFDNLVKMQHYGLPTRLLDLTTNPLVALYFACQEDKGADGEVLMYSMTLGQIKYFDSEPTCILANLAKRPSFFGENAETDYSYYISDIQKDRPVFNRNLKQSDYSNQVFCVLPKLNNARIVNQNGAFFIFGMGSAKDKAATPLDLPIKIDIKASAKERILKELNLLGINEAFMFPETDKTMQQIKKEFL